MAICYTLPYFRNTVLKRIDEKLDFIDILEKIINEKLQD
jgi:hypothetical protein